MSVTASNLLQGPAVAYWAPFGSAEPATIATLPATPFTDVGGTMGGVSFQVADDYGVLEVDQIIYEIERRRQKRVLTAKTEFAEATLANLAIAINNTAPTSNVLTADDGITAFKPSYGAFIIDGVAPGGFKRRITFRKALATANVEVAYKKDGQTTIPVEFSMHWVSASIPAFKVEDATS